MFTKGQLINERYEIIKSIGEGGMANVYLANDTFLDRKVAVKVLRGDLANDEKFIRRFQREAYAASTLSHPNIVEMYDVGEDNGTYFIVMEYIEGRTLKQLLKKRGSLTAPEVVDIMLQLTDGISHAHDMYIIHRDLKPQNIMISDDGKIKITDFGIAMALNSSQLTQTNSVMGSVHYLPPEQASGKGSTTKSDIYSMGIMLFELLTGKLPFKGENAVEIALKHMKDDIPSVRKINPNIPQSLENIVLKATAKNPKNRYDDVKEMYKDLKVCLNEENLNQKPFVYKYPEHEIDEKDSLLQEVKDDGNKKDNKPKEKPVAKKIEEPKKEKHSFSTAIIIILLLVFIGGVGAIMYVLLPTFSNTSNIKIPDVSGLTVVDAEKVLTDKGFVVADETRKEFNDKTELGLVIGTDPQVDRKRPKGTKITIIESLGKNQTYKIEDYTGRDYEKVQYELETMYKMKVEIKSKEVEITGNIEEEKKKIIEQSIAPGTEIIISEENPTTITLYIPLAYDGYPDFVAEGWSVDDIKAFAEKYEITVNVKEKETTDYPAGTVIEQNRAPKSKIYNRVSLTITVAKEPTKKEEQNTGSPENTSGKETNTEKDKNTNTSQ